MTISIGLRRLHARWTFELVSWGHMVRLCTYLSQTVLTSSSEESWNSSACTELWAKVECSLLSMPTVLDIQSELIFVNVWCNPRNETLVPQEISLHQLHQMSKSVWTIHQSRHPGQLQANGIHCVRGRRMVGFVTCVTNISTSSKDKEVKNERERVWYQKMQLWKTSKSW